MESEITTIPTNAEKISQPFSTDNRHLRTCDIMAQLS